MRIPGSDSATKNLIKWSARDNWAPLEREVFDAHVNTAEVLLDAAEGDIADLVATTPDLCMFIEEDFCCTRFGRNEEMNVIDDYLQRRGWRETVPGRRYLEALRDSTVSLYEVVDVEPGRSMTVSDLIRGGDSVTVDERDLSKVALRQDRLAARIIGVGSTTRFTAGLLGYSDTTGRLLQTEAARILEETGAGDAEPSGKGRANTQAKGGELTQALLSSRAFAQLLTHAWLMDMLLTPAGPLSSIRNSDGHRYVYSAVRFELAGDEAEVAAVLDGIEEFEREAGKAFWAWNGPGSPRRRPATRTPSVLPSGSGVLRRTIGGVTLNVKGVVLNTNSIERARRGRDLLTQHLGDLLAAARFSHSSPLETPHLWP